ncbi:MAG: sigma-70 family RNA polymerase sigma factor [Acidobacteria bacterium]|nr:sigma-70 family RNA polymerase sigma factor [Acidobacteriota bacterium]
MELPLSATELHRDHDLMTLLLKVAEGDQSAFTTLYEATSKAVFGLVLRILNDRATAEEVLLDVFTQAWRQAGNYDRGRGTPIAWLMTIARSRAIDRLRSGKHDQQKDTLEHAGELTAQTPSPEDHTVIAERQKMVRQAIESLSPEQKEVIELAYYSGLSHTEIATKLGHPLGTVKTRTRLAMIKMREMLSPIFSR